MPRPASLHTWTQNVARLTGPLLHVQVQVTAAAANADGGSGTDSAPMGAGLRQSDVAAAEPDTGPARGRAQARRAPGIQSLAKAWSPAAAPAEPPATVLTERWVLAVLCAA